MLSYLAVDIYQASSTGIFLENLQSFKNAILKNTNEQFLLYWLFY